MKAIKNGFRVYHYVLDDLIQVLRAEETPEPPPATAVCGQFGSIIDEVGFRPLDRQEANLFFRLESRRWNVVP